MSPSPISSPPISDSERSVKRKKKKAPKADSKSIKWRSETQHQIYCSKLLRALSAAPRRARAVREAADEALAVAGKGRTRWSRAILSNRLKLRFRKQKRPKAAVAGGGGRRKPRVSVLRLRGRGMTAAQRKVKVLGRLVPGCRKEALPVILEEARDYIAALEMQVRAMSALAELLSLAGSGSAPSPSPTT